MNSRQKSRVRAHTKVLEPKEDPKKNEIKICPGNTRLFRLKRTIRRRRTSEKVQCANCIHMAAGIHSTIAESYPVPTTNQLAATNYELGRLSN